MPPCFVIPILEETLDRRHGLIWVGTAIHIQGVCNLESINSPDREGRHKGIQVYVLELYCKLFATVLTMDVLPTPPLPVTSSEETRGLLLNGDIQADLGLLTTSKQRSGKVCTNTESRSLLVLMKGSLQSNNNHDGICHYHGRSSKDGHYHWEGY